MADTLIELAERCEKAEGPDRELDREIALAAGWEYQGNLQFGWYTPHWWRDGRSPREVVGLWVPEGQLPAFTDSLDAAITLVLEDLRISHLGEARYMTRSPAFFAQLEEWTSVDGVDRSERRAIGVAATLSLALCAAALRARAAMKVKA